MSEFLQSIFRVSNPSDARGNTITARELLDRACERVVSELEDQPLVQARMMNTMGLVYYSLGLYDKSTPLVEEAQRLRREHLPGSHDDIAASINYLAGVLARKGDYDAAEPLYREALAMRRRPLGHEHEDVASNLSNLAGLLQARGDDEAAEPRGREYDARLHALLPTFRFLPEGRQRGTRWHVRAVGGQVAARVRAQPCRPARRRRGGGPRSRRWRGS